MKCEIKSKASNAQHGDGRGAANSFRVTHEKAALFAIASKQLLRKRSAM